MFNNQQQQSPIKTSTFPYVCYRCNKPGHFIKDCPESTPNRSPISRPSSSSSSTTPPDPEFPSTHCHCGAGLCDILISRSVNNPGRKYYRCPGKFDKSCGYFKWCDNLREDEVRKSEPELNFPTCGCRAGVCSLKVESSGPDAGRSYFACPIKKGDGACNFKQWSNDSRHSASINPEDVAADENSLVDEFDLSYEEAMQIDAIQMDARKVSIQMEVGEEVKTSDGVDEISATARSTETDPRQPVRYIETCPCPSAVNNSLKEMLALNQEHTAEDEMENLQQSITTVVANPCNPVSQGTPNFGPITMPEDNASTPSVILENSSEDGFEASRGLDHQTWSGLLLNPSGLLKDSLNEGITMSSTILLTFETTAHHFRNRLVTILESMDPKDHGIMSKEADCTFAALDHLQVDYGLFRSRVTQYIKQAANLAHIEQTMEEDTFSKDLMNHYRDQKSHSDEIFRAYCEANDTYIASSKKLNSLCKDSSYVRDMLNELEKEIAHYEVENTRNRDSFSHISKTMLECKDSLQASFREATEAQNRYEKKQIERSAAKAAFDQARAQLRK